MGVDAITFFLAAFTLLFLFIPSPRRANLTAGGRQRSVWQDIAEGMRFIRQRPALLWLLASFTAANLLGSPMFVFQPLLAKFNLAADTMARGWSFEQTLAFMVTFSSLGGLAGGVLVSVWGGLISRRVYGVLVPMVVAALAEIVFGLSSLLYLTVAMIFTVGVMVTVMNAHTRAIWQAQTPHELQGRVFSVRRLIAQCTAPLGTALAGFAGGFVNPGWLLAVMGFFFLVFSLGQLFNRTLLAVENEQSSSELVAVPVSAVSSSSSSSSSSSRSDDGDLVDPP
jgi:hypothetical protein